VRYAGATSGWTEAANSNRATTLSQQRNIVAAAAHSGRHNGWVPVPYGTIVESLGETLKFLLRLEVEY